MSRCVIVRESSPWGDEALYDHLGRLLASERGISTWTVGKHGCTGEIEQRIVEPDDLVCPAPPGIPPDLAPFFESDELCWLERLDAMETRPA